MIKRIVIITFMTMLVYVSPLQAKSMLFRYVPDGTLTWVLEKDVLIPANSRYSRDDHIEIIELLGDPGDHEYDVVRRFAVDSSEKFERVIPAGTVFRAIDWKDDSYITLESSKGRKLVFSYSFSEYVAGWHNTEKYMQVSSDLTVKLLKTITKGLFRFRMHRVQPKAW